MDELEYRRLLKTLPHAIEPDRDLFPGIAVRLHARRPQQARRASRALFPLAAAAGVVAIAIAAGWIGLQRAPSSDAAVVSRATPPVLREARALRAEYDALLLAGGGAQWAELREQADPRLVAAWTELDAAEAELTAALEIEPGARFLLNQLKQVQHKRLQLTQQALSA